MRRTYEPQETYSTLGSTSIAGLASGYVTKVSCELLKYRLVVFGFWRKGYSEVLEQEGDQERTVAAAHTRTRGPLWFTTLSLYSAFSKRSR
jgi:hypothetical protein